MSEQTTEYLYSIRAENSLLKKAATEAHANIEYDRQYRAYKLDLSHLTPEGEAKAREKLAPYMSDHAKAAWEADKAVNLAEKANDPVKAAAAKMAESGAVEQVKISKVKLTEENSILVYPAHSQREEFNSLIVETQSRKQYVMGTANKDAHFLVMTDKPEAFQVYRGEEAQARFKKEFMERGGVLRVNDKDELIREAAKKINGKAFMGQYRERGFRLGNPGRDSRDHQNQLNDMRDATSSQIVAVLNKSREILNGLRDKEAAMRAEVSGMSVEQIKAMPFDEQKKIVGSDGLAVGLKGEEFNLNAQLTRGIKAMDIELNARGIRAKDNSRSQGQSVAQGAVQSTQRGVDPSLSTARKPVMAAEESASNEMNYLQQAMNRRNGNGRG